MPRLTTAPHFQGNGAIGFRQREVADPAPGQLLLRCTANALCGSDRHQYLNGSAITPGHEAAGVVVEGGAGTSTPVGTPGVVFLMEFCGECRNCRLGKTNLCLAKRADIGFTHDGGFGEYMLVSEHIFFAVDRGLSAVDATLLLDVMGTGGHAIERAKLTHPDIQSVLVTGAGPIGLGVLAMARTILGPDVPVYISDIVTTRLELAESLGGIGIDVSQGTLADGLRSHGVASVDVAIDTSGRTEARQEAVPIVGKPGGIVCVGHGGEIRLEISRDVIGPEHVILGSEYFPYADLALNHERLLANPEYFRRIVTDVMDIEAIAMAYDRFLGGHTGKVVVTHELD